MRLFRRRSEQLDVPTWANSMSSADYAEFRRLVDAWFRSHDRGFRDLGDGSLEVQTSDSSRRLGLHNLLQGCQLLPHDKWAEQIATHLAAVMSTSEVELTYEQAEDLIKVRVYAEHGIPGDADVVLRPVAEGLVAMLVLDFPTSVRSVKPKEVESWGVDTDPLFRLGLDNVRAQDRPELIEQSGVAFKLLAGDSSFSSTWLLLLDHYLDSAANGAVVAVPNRHLVVFQPIVDMSILRTVQLMLPFVHARYQEGPGSISPNLYWWRSGQITLLPASFQRGQVGFMPPDEFMAMLNTLAPAKQA